LATLVAALLSCGLVLSSAASAQAPLSIRIEGNHFVNGEGQTIRLLGVNHPSLEYACVDGYGYDDEHMDAADAAAISSWNASAVRVPLNEDCWLGLNGQPNSSQGADPPLTVAGYRQEVENYVADLNAHGLYAILDLHWTAPGAKIANGQQPMPDEHSASFWSSVAATFKGDPAVVFDVFNEPFSPADPRSGDDPAHPVSWSCWENGGCTVPYYEETATRTGVTYTAVGMQALVSAIRAAGATQPVIVGGLDYANDLTGWVEHAPDDPLNQEAASFHNYMGKSCDNVGCWNDEVAPVAANVPVVTGEFDQDVCAPSNFDEEFMAWADEHGVGYLAWGWWVLTPGEIAAAGCSAYYLLTSYDGTPAPPNGTTLRSHLLSLPPGGDTLPGGGATGTGGSGGAGSGPSTGSGTGPGGRKPPVTLLGFRVQVEPAGTKLSLTLTAAKSCAGVVAGRSAKAFKVSGHKPRKLALGTTHLALAAGKRKTVVLKLPAPARKLLATVGSLRARFTLRLSGAQNAATILKRPATLKAP